MARRWAEVPPPRTCCGICGRAPFQARRVQRSRAMTSSSWSAVSIVGAAALLCSSLVVSSACSRDVEAVSPQALQQQYGITDAYTGQVATSDGVLRGTLVPVTLPDGRRAELIIPNRRAAEPHPVYLRDGGALYPVELQPNVTRQQVAAAPVVVERRTERAQARHRAWEKELLIIGGSAGAGAAGGGPTGGEKRGGAGARGGGGGGGPFRFWR